MREYLFKYNDQYTLVELSKKDAESNPEQYIEVPEGADAAFKKKYGDGLCFFQCVGENGADWCSETKKWISRIHPVGDWYFKNSPWQRHTQPEELPFMDSLNDQYAEIEQVRQSAYDKQEGGSHYKKLAIQPMQYALTNKLDYAQANVVKYVTRHADKNGKEDLLKAIHNIELMIEHYYGVEK